VSRLPLLIGILLAACASIAHAQLNAPHIGYLCPAGGRQGDTVRVTVGGQYLNEDAKACVSGSGVHAKVVQCVKPLTPREVNELRERADALRKKPRDPAITKELAEIRTKLSAARNMMNPSIAERAIVEISIDKDAAPEPRELRLQTAAGSSNPLAFHVGQLPEFVKEQSEKVVELPPGAERRDNEPRRREPEMNIALPATVNGQILPGGVDRYRFSAHSGQRIVVVVSARELIPYLADAVPGWFQAAVALYDGEGKELAYDDHYRFEPDPVISCRIPKDGAYVLEIRDALYRGREDFVYRIAIGELPFVTSAFPLGGPAEKHVEVELKGWNLPVNKLSLDAEALAKKSVPPFAGEETAIVSFTVDKGKMISNRLPFAVDALPECLEQEPNNESAKAQAVTLPTIVNGRIDSPGDWDVFRFEGRAGQKIVADVNARKLGSPLDSLLKLTDADGRQLVMNDDSADKADGLSTHHADSYLLTELPANGLYYVWLGDSQHKGGPEFGYRLRLSEPQVDFALCAVPSSVNVRAGSSSPITVYALRRDGFAGEISVRLKDAPKGIKLSGDARIPADKDEVKLTLSAAPISVEEPLRIAMEGRATVGGREMVRRAVPADDMMQAFIYHHLVPADDLLLTVARRVPPRLQLKYAGPSPVRILPGKTVTLHFTGPRGPMLEQMGAVLKDPPEGIIMENAAQAQDGLDVLVHADADKVRVGQRGNLLVGVFVERAPPPEKGKPAAAKRRVPLGTLPAIPFEVIGSAP
jgi:hypothetical protein